jgi:hypothetical protein
MAISGNKLEDIIKPEMMPKYKKGLEGFCDQDEVEADDDYHWFPRTCCTKHKKLDKRTPGLFKEEFCGDEIVALCSKTYMVTGPNGTKYSCKGINKTALEEPEVQYPGVLDTQTPVSGKNRGFRAKNNTIFSYTQEKKGLSYFYCKRKVLNNRIDTEPLDVVLRPPNDGQ